MTMKLKLLENMFKTEEEQFAVILLMRDLARQGRVSAITNPEELAASGTNFAAYIQECCYELEADNLIWIEGGSIDEARGFIRVTPAGVALSKLCAKHELRMIEAAEKAAAKEGTSDE